MPFDFEVVYTKGEAIPDADALSRLSFADEEPSTPSEEAVIHWTGQSVVPWEQLQRDTEGERLLQDVRRRVSSNNWANCSPAERPFKSVRRALMVEDGVLCVGDRPVIPKVLRQRVLQLVHDTHQGASATRSRLQNSAWWPGYCGDVEDFVRNCPTCRRIRPAQQQSAVHTWPTESEPWHRVHMDHATLPKVGLLLILVDAMSGWPEAVRVANREAATVKRVLQTVFARNGVPHVLVSDNAAEFHDAELTNWLQRIGCRVMKTPPMHPQSNGLAERMVQSIKKASAA
jgi:transposase InsO family protein